MKLTDAQMTVLRALDALPEGEWTTAKEGGFNGNSAGRLVYPSPWAPEDQRLVAKARDGLYRLTPAGRAYLSTLTPASEDRPHG